MNRLLYLLLFLVGTVGVESQQAQVPASKYICPPCNSTCDELEYDQPGVCTHCNMALVKKTDAKTIAFYLQDGVEILDFAGPMEVFTYAGYEVFTVSDLNAPIQAQRILTVTPDYSLENAPEADILAFFGGNASSASKNKRVIEWVKNQKNIQYYFSVCTGAFILAEAGILDGKTATTFHSALDDLEGSYEKIDVRKNVRFVDNGNVITTAGISAGIDGALHLVAKLRGVNAAKRTAYYMEYDNWNMGDGLILTEPNPYSGIAPHHFFEDFTGIYEYRNNQEIKVIFHEKKGHLMAIMNDMAYPIYHETQDSFTDAEGGSIFFKRNESGTIIGYALNQNLKIYRKL